MFISLLESLKGQFEGHCFLPSVLLHVVIWFLNMQFYIISNVDDSQLCVSFRSNNSNTALNSSRLCLAAVQYWMLMKKVKQNSSLLAMNSRGANVSLCFQLRLLILKLTQQNLFGNWESFFDNKFTFHSCIAAVCSSRFYHISDLHHIRHHLDLDSATTCSCCLGYLLMPWRLAALITAIQPCCLDYCDSVLFGRHWTY